MGIKSGPSIVSDGLVLCLDAISADSYPGEPTDNKQPNNASSRFTSSNSWGTYNTNQYNSNNYFSIGTISSVSDNIVTTSSSHPFRTFDAVRAQTTGGGITAGTDYFIKKLSSTTFTIHAYNSSQDGTQGYIRSDGYHQVHESIATDTRVSINATDFPTMWWGAPHLPNTCHVKELRIGEGPIKGTNCMRVHVTRTEGVSGGMSYGVNVSGATQGDTITSSWWARSSLPGSKTVQYYTYWGSGYSANSVNFTPTQEWQKFTHTWTASNTYGFIQYWFQGSHTSGAWWFDVADIQTEINKSYSSPYVLPESDRSSTNGWKDISGHGNHGTLTNMTGTGLVHYRSGGSAERGGVILPTGNSYLDFDGSNDYIDGPTVAPNIGAFTYEAVIYRTSSDFLAVGTGTALGGGTYMQIYVYDAGMRVNLYNPQVLGGGWKTGSTIPNTSNTFENNNIYHITVVNDGTVFYFYKNGVSLGSYDHSYLGNTGSTRLGILRNHVQSTGGTGRVYLVRMYNKALTAAEVLRNFNATKERFSL